MSVQKKKLTRRKVRARRSHHALKPVKLISCPKCKKATKPHYACPFCGYYRGRMVIDVEKKLAKKRTKHEQRQAEKEKAKEEASQAKAEKKQDKKDEKAKKVVV